MSNPRADYSSIVSRPPLHLPNGAKVAFWFILNVEEWDFEAKMARAVLPTPQGATIVPDVPNYSWHDYGMRVGFWRIKEVLDKYGIKATISLNGSVCNSYPEIVQAMVDSDWEIMGHGFIQKALPLEDDEAGVIGKTIDTIRDFSGTAPRGWMGPGLAETVETPDLLVEAGIEYVCDWVNDDQPYVLKTKTGRLVSMPYTVEMNDIPMYVVQNHRSPEMYERGKDHFDTLYREGAESARIMAIATHPYISGVPHRIKYLDMILDYITSHDDVVIWTGGQILDWYNESVRQDRPDTEKANI